MHEARSKLELTARLRAALLELAESGAMRRDDFDWSVKQAAYEHLRASLEDPGCDFDELCTISARFSCL